ncbi:MAG: orotate phosphoribosyltransferase [Sulfurospirillaceae bacterium]|jgi:orotate phosphoribosyltransferase|nr:orotate phosphoribosyltransferase [Sulfurospirillaceae bacterium]MDD2825286.1 orotate phosphoribosyltransferase [Sulfurospirillaceae bacterium]
MQIEQIYKDANALLEGHFLLSSGKHSQYYLQSAKVLENPKIAEELAIALATMIQAHGVEVDTICSPALGGVLAGYELARSLGKRFIFAERVNGEMTIRRGFDIKEGEKILVCEDIITTGGSALEAARVAQNMGGVIVGYAALANRGFCQRVGSELKGKLTCKLPNDVPFFALADFEFDIYEPTECPLCKLGTKAIKPGSRGN